MTEGGNIYEAYRNKKDKIIPLLKYITKKMRIVNLSLKLGMGTGDAAATGILYGIAWIAIGSVMTLTRSYLNISEPKIVVAPIFNKVQLSVDFNCIISIKVGHIINTGIRAITLLPSGIRK